MLMNYHIGRLVLSSLCIGSFVAAGIWWCSFCRLKQILHRHIILLVKTILREAEVFRNFARFFPKLFCFEI